jgi:hypothetical protein
VGILFLSRILTLNALIGGFGVPGKTWFDWLVHSINFKRHDREELSQFP